MKETIVEYVVAWNCGKVVYSEEQFDLAKKKFDELSNWKPDEHQSESDIHSITFSECVIQKQILDFARYPDELGIYQNRKV
jgi:hypothetical protein